MSFRSIRMCYVVINGVIEVYDLIFFFHVFKWKIIEIWVFRSWNLDHDIHLEWSKKITNKWRIIYPSEWCVIHQVFSFKMGRMTTPLKKNICGLEFSNLGIHVKFMCACTFIFLIPLFFLYFLIELFLNNYLIMHF
jgi:hypothetical protein